MFDLVKAHFICDQREPSENHGVVVTWGGGSHHMPARTSHASVLWVPAVESGLPKRGLGWCLLGPGRPVLI